jgi:hypothetical protein
MRGSQDGIPAAVREPLFDGNFEKQIAIMENGCVLRRYPIMPI